MEPRCMEFGLRTLEWSGRKFTVVTLVSPFWTNDNGANVGPVAPKQAIHR